MRAPFAELGLERIKQAQAQGQLVWTETCPQYLLLTDAEMARVGPLAKIGPPLRPEGGPDQDALWRGLEQGYTSIVGSDHSPHPQELKQPGWDNIFVMPNGAPVPFGSPGVETIVSLMYSEGVVKRGLPISCFLNEAADSLEGILGLWNENVWLAARGGGIGSYWGNLRSIGERVGHTLVLGTTRVGKTRLAETLITQDIRRGDVVIVFDPKGDADLLRRVYAEAKRAGRAKNFYMFHLGYPEVSARYNAIGNFSRITEVATRIANQLPSEGNSAAFKEFAWRFVNIIARALVALDRRPDYQQVRRYINDIEPLFMEYARDHLRRQGAEDWQEKVAEIAGCAEEMAGGILPLVSAYFDQCEEPHSQTTPENPVALEANPEGHSGNPDSEAP